jgi:hypothetical protein
MTLIRATSRPFSRSQPIYVHRGLLLYLSLLSLLVTALLACICRYKDGRKLTGIIYMHRISDVRVGGTSGRSLGMFRSLCGPDALKNVVAVTNFWGDVDSKVGTTREKELMAEDIFFKPILDSGGYMMRHDRSLKSAQSILRRLLHNSPITLNIQRQLVEKKMALVETDAGSELIIELKRQEEGYQEEVRVLQSEMEVAIKAKDEGTKQELGQALRDAQAQLKHVRTSANSLAQGLQDIESMLSLKNYSRVSIDFTGKLHQVRMFISTSVRKRLEVSLVTITTELKNIDGSRQSVEAFRARLAEEYSRMGKSISEEIESGDAPGSPQPSPMDVATNNSSSGRRERYLEKLMVSILNARNIE